MEHPDAYAWGRPTHPAPQTPGTDSTRNDSDPPVGAAPGSARAHRKPPSSLDLDGPAKAPVQPSTTGGRRQTRHREPLPPVYPRQTARTRAPASARPHHAPASPDVRFHVKQRSTRPPRAPRASRCPHLAWAVKRDHHPCTAPCRRPDAARHALTAPSDTGPDRTSTEPAPDPRPSTLARVHPRSPSRPRPHASAAPADAVASSRGRALAAVSSAARPATGSDMPGLQRTTQTTQPANARDNVPPPPRPVTWNANRRPAPQRRDAGDAAAAPKAPSPDDGASTRAARRAPTGAALLDPLGNRRRHPHDPHHPCRVHARRPSPPRAPLRRRRPGARSPPSRNPAPPRPDRPSSPGAHRPHAAEARSTRRAAPAARRHAQ